MTQRAKMLVAQTRKPEFGSLKPTQKLVWQYRLVMPGLGPRQTAPKGSLAS